MKTIVFFITFITIVTLLDSCGTGTTNRKPLPWPTDIKYVHKDAAYNETGKIVKIEQPDTAENYGVASTIIYISGATLEGVNKYIPQLIKAGYASYQSGGENSIKMPDPKALMPSIWQGRDSKRNILVRVVLLGEKDEEKDGIKYNLSLILFPDDY